MSTASLLPADIPSVSILPVRPWPDGVIDALGHDPRSAYVERTGTKVRFDQGGFLISGRFEAVPAGTQSNSPEDLVLAANLPAPNRRHSPTDQSLASFEPCCARPGGSLVVMVSASSSGACEPKKRNRRRVRGEPL